MVHELSSHELDIGIKALKLANLRKNTHNDKILKTICDKCDKFEVSLRE